MWRSRFASRLHPWRSLALSLAAAALPMGAAASDGVIEINQVRALAGGISPADTPGFPVTLSSGSYRLTGNLQGSSANVDANTHIIEITGSSVTLDLGGFTVASWASCTGLPTPGCTTGGAGWGIYAAPSTPITPNDNTVIKNGYVRSTFAGGIALNSWARVRDVSVRRTGGIGILVGDDSLIRDSIARDNVALGFSSGVGAIVRDSLQGGNGQFEAPAAVGDDGVVLISQELALAGGVAPGDAPGFPVTLPSGNYRLISDLAADSTMASADTDIIEITGDHTTLDLAGFSVSSWAECEGMPNPGCTTTGSGSGIGAASNSHVRVKNGIVHSTFLAGVAVGEHGRVEDVSVHSTGWRGIFASAHSQIINCSASNNVSEGLWATSGSVFGSTAQGNAGRGITASVVTDSASFGNGTTGISANVAHSNVARDNETGVSADVARGNYVLDASETGVRAGAALHNVVQRTVGGSPVGIGIDAYGPAIGNWVAFFATGILADGAHRDNELQFNTTNISPSSTGLATGPNACNDAACP